MAPMKRRRPRPIRGRLPGQGEPKPSQRKTGPKKPWDRAVNTAKEASSWLNPFD